MPDNDILSEFLNENRDELAQRLTELFDSILNNTDESAAETLKSELENILEERINALNEN
jgi:hypothetical protein